MRAIWKGHLQFSLVTIPVRLYTAIDSGRSISFNLLTRDNHPVSYEKKDKITGEPLKNEDIVKGYQYSPGQYVIIGDEDFDKVKLKSEKVVEITGFVTTNEINPMLLETPYFLGPDGDVAAKTYSLLSQTLQQTGKVGIGTVVLRDRETPVMIYPVENGLAMYRMRYEAEIRSIRDVPQYLDKSVESEQIKLATTLVESMSVPFGSMKIEDRYYDALKSIIDAKIEGKEVVMAVEEEPEQVIDILTALKASIEAAKKPMEKVAGDARQEEVQKKRRKAS